jgi:hypothetical protein
VHARLPAIAFYETGVQYKAPIVRADDGFHDDAVVKGVPSTVLVADDPNTYEVPSHSNVYELYWQPKKLTSTESLEGVGDLIPLSTIRVNLPSNGSLQGNDIVWSGSFGLSATFSAVGREFEATRSRNDFLSGIFFAIAATAVIALIQELPDPTDKI